MRIRVLGLVVAAAGLAERPRRLLDARLRSSNEDYHIIVARGHCAKSSPHQKPLAAYHGQRIRLPANQEIWPGPRHLAWHRKQRLRAGIR